MLWTLTTNNEIAEHDLVRVCETIRDRVHILPDERSKQIIGDALEWTIRNPSELHYNCKSKKDVLTITPNLIGFQFVMHGIARRIANPKAASRIVVDQQSQFNKAQRTIAEFYANARDVPWVMGPGLPMMDLSNIPETPIEFCAGGNSIGLELVDLYLWVFKHVMEGKELAPEVAPIITSQLHRGHTDEVSINALAAKWSRWFENLPEPTEEEERAGKELLALLDEARRLRAVRNST